MWVNLLPWYIAVLMITVFLITANVIDKMNFCLGNTARWIEGGDLTAVENVRLHNRAAPAPYVDHGLIS